MQTQLASSTSAASQPARCCRATPSASACFCEWSDVQQLRGMKARYEEYGLRVTRTSLPRYWHTLTSTEGEEEQRRG